MTRKVFPALLLALAVACSSEAARSPDGATPSPTIGARPQSSLDGTWTLTALGDSTNVAGAGGRAIKMIVTRDSARVAGFAGCNQYSGPFTVAGDSIKFGALISTKMACPGWPMQLETMFLVGLTDAVTYTASDSTLLLNQRTGKGLRFKR